MQLLGCGCVDDFEAVVGPEPDRDLAVASGDMYGFTVEIVKKRCSSSLLSPPPATTRKTGLLVATDVGARGLDVADVALVVNWDLPGAPEEYTHRVGRTARAGRGGVAVSFVTERDEERVLKIEERISECSRALCGRGR